MMRSLGILLARGGSTRIPRKNVKPLLGHPLIAYGGRAALASGLSRVILSTDDDEIAAAAQQYGVDAPFRRPAELSKDVPTEHVTRHALDWAEADEGAAYDIVVTLQPTTPFILPEHIDACIESVAVSDAACCFTAQRASQPPQWMFTLDDDGTATPLLDGVIEGERGVFQSLPACYLPNGGAYATRVSAFRAWGRIISDPARLFIMDAARSVDLDEPEDWLIAEAMGTRHGFSLLPLEGYENDSWKMRRN
ncbi:MAG: acylneuraminate cytidylyltransferase family protein [Alphaproteobacteria bacterium]|jgi:N-acylneuraminate cytidylyltransferase|nr:acylneuraminate cytidylyltransferase family protein [Alphaproteobacteria bacterium]